jgi:hypothetical protein
VYLYIAYDGKDNKNGNKIGNGTEEGGFGRQWDDENLVFIQGSTEDDNGEDKMQHEEGE